MNVWSKILIFFPLLALFTVIFYGFIFLLYPESISASKSELEMLLKTDSLFLLLNQLAMLFGTVCTVFFISRVLDKEKNFYSKYILNLRGLFNGIILGFILILFSIVFVSFSEGIKIEYKGFNIDIFYLLLVFILVAAGEEILGRGFILHILYEKINKHFAILISSVIFSLMHVYNSSFNMVAFLNLILAGILFAFLYVQKMNLSVPIGLHFSWNFFQGPVFGFSVSGLDTASLFKITPASGSQYKFAGFGLEGSGAATIFLSLVVLYFYYSYFRQRKGIVLEIADQ